jgi:hypothetical protein
MFLLSVRVFLACLFVFLFGRLCGTPVPVPVGTWYPAQRIWKSRQAQVPVPHGTFARSNPFSLSPYYYPTTSYQYQYQYQYQHQYQYQCQYHSIAILRARRPSLCRALLWTGQRW